MDLLKPLWTKIGRSVAALEGIDGPTGDCMFSVGKRLDKLERDVGRLQTQPHTHPGNVMVADHATADDL